MLCHPNYEKNSIRLQMLKQVLSVIAVLVLSQCHGPTEHPIKMCCHSVSDFLCDVNKFSRSVISRVNLNDNLSPDHDAKFQETHEEMNNDAFLC